MTQVGAIEGGGTWFRAAVGTPDGHIRASVRLPTTEPDGVVEQITAFFEERGPVAAVGVGCFGPLRLDPTAPDYGALLDTPKPAWRAYPLGARLQTRLGCPLVFETDVGAAAWGELHHGAGRGCESLVYVTIGTGVGAGLVAGGRIVHGRLHPEAGHMRVPRRADDPFEGVCPHHGDCVEGRVSGPALAARWGRPAESLPAGHPAWDEAARVIGQLVHNLSLTLAPDRVILGGGVAQAPGLLDGVRRVFDELEGGYRAGFTGDPHVVAAGCGDQAALRGGLILAGARPL